MVTKTLEEIVDEVSENFMYSLSFKPKLFALEVAKEIRKLTLEEAANKAEADYNIVCADDRVEYTINGEVEVYVLKESILQLDKNSIEI